jgi:hypothetical protein
VYPQQTIDPVAAGTGAEAPEESPCDTSLVVILLAEVHGDCVLYLRELVCFLVLRIVLLHHLAQVLFVVACVRVVIHSDPTC